jgi:hypothetical protein
VHGPSAEARSFNGTSGPHVWGSQARPTPPTIGALNVRHSQMYSFTVGQALLPSMHGIYSRFAFFEYRFIGQSLTFISLNSESKYTTNYTVLVYRSIPRTGNLPKTGKSRPRTRSLF